jgi:hypothetical protein
MHEKTGHDNKGMSGHGFTFPVGGSVPVIFISMHPGHRSRYGKYGPRSGYGFLRTACQPIRIENFEKPYNKILYFKRES